MYHLIDKAITTGVLVRVKNNLDEGETRYDGYVTAVSKKLIMIHLLADNISLDGYEVVRLRDVLDVQVPAPYSQFVASALTLKGEKLDESPLIDLSSMRVAIESAAERYPLITVMNDDEGCRVGQVVATGPQSFVLQEIDPAAKWIDKTELLYSEVTRLSFGGGYETALALVAKLV